MTKNHDAVLKLSASTIDQLRETIRKLKIKLEVAQNDIERKDKIILVLMKGDKDVV